MRCEVFERFLTDKLNLWCLHYIPNYLTRSPFSNVPSFGFIKLGVDLQVFKGQKNEAESLQERVLVFVFVVQLIKHVGIVVVDQVPVSTRRSSECRSWYAQLMRWKRRNLHRLRCCSCMHFRGPLFIDKIGNIRKSFMRSCIINTYFFNHPVG